jgi:ABC-type uncharacterized transport system substrate-binding protein
VSRRAAKQRDELTAFEPLGAHAQQARNRKLGVLHPGQSTIVSARIAALREGLSGRDDQRDSGIEVIIRLADGDLSRLPALATDLVNNRVDAIVATSPPAVQAASGATTSVPVIAIDLESDPVASGWVARLARPGRNVTGVFLDFPEFSAKCLELLIESVPMLAGVGVLLDPSTGSLQLKAVEAAAQQFRIRMQVFEARRAGDVAGTFYSLDRSRIQGILLLSSPLFAASPQMVADLASEEVFRQFRCSTKLQERAGCSPTGRTFSIFFARSENWRARFCKAQRSPSCQRSGRHDSSSWRT